jgi:hypothetical protein
MRQKREIEWSRLDNYSKIFPASWSLKDPKVFRLSCELFEAVEPCVLQSALDAAMNDFPLYRYVLRRGLFWYYLESSEMRPEIKLESDPVCAPIYVGRKSNLLFRVSFFNSRINLEVFHVLSDGAGAIRFMKSLVYNYLSILHPDQFTGAVLDEDLSSLSEQMDDSYNKHWMGNVAFRKLAKEEKKQAKVRAYRIRGARMPENRIALIEGAMSTRALLDEAHKYHVSMTVLISSLLIHSIYKTMPNRRNTQPVVLAFPINLRQFFESSTTRNFFSVINIGYHFDHGDELKPLIQSVDEDLKKRLTTEQLNYQLYKFIAVERNPFTRIVPLPIKNSIIRLAVKSFDRYTTSNISNVGKIQMPSEFASSIRQFSVCTSVRRPQITMCSYLDRTLISFTSPFEETDLQRTFFRMLSKMGIDVEISSNI